MSPALTTGSIWAVMVKTYWVWSIGFIGNKLLCLDFINPSQRPPTSPEGRGRFARANRVRGYGPSIALRPLTRIASSMRSDLSPLGRGEASGALSLLRHVLRQPGREQRERDQDHQAHQVGGNEREHALEDGRKRHVLHHALDHEH